MVPGMTERDRLAADVGRLEWLAEARFGPTTAPGPCRQAAAGEMTDPWRGAARRVRARVIAAGKAIRVVRAAPDWFLAHGIARREPP